MTIFSAPTDYQTILLYPFKLFTPFTGYLLSRDNEVKIKGLFAIRCIIQICPLLSTISHLQTEIDFLKAKCSYERSWLLHSMRCCCSCQVVQLLPKYKKAGAFTSNFLSALCLTLCPAVVGCCHSL